MAERGCCDRQANADRNRRLESCLGECEVKIDEMTQGRRCEKHAESVWGKENVREDDTCFHSGKWVYRSLVESNLVGRTFLLGEKQAALAWLAEAGVACGMVTILVVQVVET